MLILRLGAIAPQERPNAGGDTCLQGEGLETISKTLRSHSQPNALDFVYQQVPKFSQNKRADQTTDRRFLEFEARVRMGGSLSDESVPVLRA